MTVPDRELSVNIHPLKDQGDDAGGPSGGKQVTTRRWTLRTLVAYLFDGRECAAVRTLLAGGAAVAHGERLTWSPVELTEAELVAIERTFPQAEPNRPLRLDRAVSITLVIPEESHGNGDANSQLAVALPTASSLLAHAVPRARYVWFDYGEWADVYDAPVSADEAMTAPAAARQPDENAGDMHGRTAQAAKEGAFVRFAVPRPDELPPWIAGA